MTAAADWTFCEGILPEVSRSFALIIPQCPPPIDRALCVAYLVCRIADTVEDEPEFSDAQRSRLYDALVRAVNEPLDEHRAKAFLRLWPSIPQGAYGRLILGTHQVLSALADLPSSFLPPISTCVHEMVAGMRRTVPVQTCGGIRFMCRDLDELDRYCHYVAGTVGLMSTALFLTRLRPEGVALDTWREQGRRMGLGLQMTNIIKDCYRDAERGVSFIPAAFLESPGENLCPDSYRLSEAGRAELILHAAGHLDAAMEYTLAVPPDELGVRAFLLGSMLPAIATLEVAAPGDQRQPKITRAVMNQILDLIADHGGDDIILRGWYARGRARALSTGDALPQSSGPPDNSR